MIFYSNIISSLPDAFYFKIKFKFENSNSIDIDFEKSSKSVDDYISVIKPYIIDKRTESIVWQGIKIKYFGNVIIN